MDSKKTVHFTPAQSKSVDERKEKTLSRAQWLLRWGLCYPLAPFRVKNASWCTCFGWVGKIDIWKVFLIPSKIKKKHFDLFRHLAPASGVITLLTLFFYFQLPRAFDWLFRHLAPTCGFSAEFYFKMGFFEIHLPVNSYEF